VVFREPAGRAAAVKYAAKGQVLEFSGGPQGDADGKDGGSGEPVGLKGEAGALTAWSCAWLGMPCEHGMLLLKPLHSSGAMLWVMLHACGLCQQ
jgi:hypothetical protein